MTSPIIAAMQGIDKLFSDCGAMPGRDLVVEFAKIERDHGYPITREALIRCHQIAATRIRHIEDAAAAPDPSTE